MIDHYAPDSAEGEARLILRPNRSLTASQLGSVVAGFALVAASVAAISWWQGNAYAPLFALLEALILAGCLGFVWRRLGRAEVISVSRTRLAVREWPDLTERFVADPAWVRVDAEGGQVVLRAGTREVAVGSALSEAERRTLADRVLDMLRWARTPS